MTMCCSVLFDSILTVASRKLTESGLSKLVILEPLSFS